MAIFRIISVTETKSGRSVVGLDVFGKMSTLGVQLLLGRLARMMASDAWCTAQAPPRRVVPSHT